MDSQTSDWAEEPSHQQSDHKAWWETAGLLSEQVLTLQTSIGHEPPSKLSEWTRPEVDGTKLNTSQHSVLKRNLLVTETLFSQKNWRSSSLEGCNSEKLQLFIFSAHEILFYIVIHVFSFRFLFKLAKFNVLTPASNLLTTEIFIVLVMSESQPKSPRMRIGILWSLSKNSTQPTLVWLWTDFKGAFHTVFIQSPTYGGSSIFT